MEVYIRISVDSVHFWYDSGGISLSGVENCYIAYRSDSYIISSWKLGTVKSEQSERMRYKTGGNER